MFAWTSTYLFGDSYGNRTRDTAWTVQHFAIKLTSHNQVGKGLEGAYNGVLTTRRSPHMGGETGIRTQVAGVTSDNPYHSAHLVLLPGIEPGSSRYQRGALPLSYRSMKHLGKW